jgi:hypothetical protein
MAMNTQKQLRQAMSDLGGGHLHQAALSELRPVFDTPEFFQIVTSLVQRSPAVFTLSEDAIRPAGRRCVVGSRFTRTLWASRSNASASTTSCSRRLSRLQHSIVTRPGAMLMRSETCKVSRALCPPLLHCPWEHRQKFLSTPCVAACSHKVSGVTSLATSARPFPP